MATFLLTWNPDSFDWESLADLGPVCPNCHAMIHHHEPTVTVEELRDMVNERQRRA